MIDGQKTHFASDQDLLGRFVLGKLSPEEKAEFDHHITVCDDCAKAVREEMLLAAGIKRLGRNQLKVALRQRIEHPLGRPSPWPRILSAAAVIAVIAALGIYNDWFGSARRDEPPAYTDKVVPFTAQNQPSSAPSAEVPKGKREGISSGGGKDAALLEKESAAATNERISPASEQPRPTAKIVAGHPSGQFWTEGTLLPPTHADERPMAALAQNEVQYRSREAKSAGAKATEQRKQDQDSAAGSPAPILIRQMPTSALPAGRQSGRQQVPYQMIPTHVEEANGVTKLTLYLDSLLDEGELRAAQIRTVSEDSLVVIVGKERIGYRLPTQFMSQQQRTAK